MINKIILIFLFVVSVVSAEKLKIETDSSLKLLIKERGESLINFNFNITKTNKSNILPIWSDETRRNK